MRVGIDFGGVITAAPNDDQRFDTSRWREIEGAFEAIAELVERTRGQVWIISKADKATQRLTREWLTNNNYYQRTGFQPSQMRFCEKRTHKKDICVELRLTHFLDDSLEVVSALVGAVPYIYLFGQEIGPGGVAAVRGWREFMQAVRESVE